MCFRSKPKVVHVHNPLYDPPECPICLDAIWSHAFWCPHCKKPHHKVCLKKWKKPSCPLCRGKIRLR